MNRLIAILEDDGARVTAMETALRDKCASCKFVFVDNAPDFIHWIQSNAEPLALISLDHDLGACRLRDGQTFDPGTGRDVANSLATMEPRCPILIHSTNYHGMLGMAAILRDANWQVVRVIPDAGTDWIKTRWIDAVCSALEQRGCDS